MKAKESVDLQRRNLVKAALALVGTVSLGPLTSCGGGGGDGGAQPPTDTTPPSITDVSPANGTTSVTRDFAPEVTFSEQIAATADAVTLTGPRGLASASLTVSGTKIRVTPERRLGFGERYTLKVTSSVKDLAGNPYPGSSTEFSTIPRNTALSLGAMIIDSYVRRRWSSPGTTTWNSLPNLFDSGFEWMRVWVTTQTFPELRANPPDQWYKFPWRNEYWSCLEVSGALLREAADIGFRQQAVLFLSHMTAHAGQQFRPPEWAGLSEDAVAAKIEEHAKNVASYYKSLGLSIEVFEIGNETDFGLCGVQLGDTVPVPPGVDPVNDPAWMRDNVWTLMAPMMKAAIRGVREVYPTSKILLHVAGFGYSNNNVAPKGFFQSMIDLGVQFDIAGLSYPYMHAGNAVPQPYFKQTEFLGTLDFIANLGKAVQIVEFDYPNASTGMIHAAPAEYPFTPNGQAAFITDFSAAVRGKVEAIHYWYPDWYPGFDSTHPELENCGLFSALGAGLSALEVFNAIAERKLLT